MGLTVQSVGAWAKQSGAPVSADGKRYQVLWPAFARWRESELLKRARLDAAPGDYDRERTRKMAADASLSELQLAKERGALVTIDDYSDALGRVLDLLTARLRATPVRFSHFSTEVEAFAEAEVERIIVEMAEFDDDILPEPEEQAA